MPEIIIFLLVVLIYIYVGYPALLLFLSRFIKKPHKFNLSHQPTVTLIISCFNEADVIDDKIKNSLAIDYPEDLLDIILISDGSTDGTDEIIRPYLSDRVKLIHQEGRLGKTAGLNLGLPEAAGNIIVFTDANAMYQPDAITKLARHFDDPEIGYVVGAALYTDRDSNAAATSENSYWDYEIRLKQLESQLHSVVGGDGAIYAIRKTLYQPLDHRDINDFVNPLQIVAAGYRGVFEPEAICFEETAGDFRKEAKRKQRIVNRSFRGLMKTRDVMNPFKTGLFSLMVISHKLLRWLVPVWIIGIGAGTSLMIFEPGTEFKILFVLGVLFIWLAIGGFYQQNRETISPFFFYPYYFLMVNYYSLAGVLQTLRGDIQITWATSRQSTDDDAITIWQHLIAAALVIVPILLFFLAIS